MVDLVKIFESNVNGLISTFEDNAEGFQKSLESNWQGTVSSFENANWESFTDAATGIWHDVNAGGGSLTQHITQIVENIVGSQIDDLRAQYFSADLGIDFGAAFDQDMTSVINYYNKLIDDATYNVSSIANAAVHTAIIFADSLMQDLQTWKNLLQQKILLEQQALENEYDKGKEAAENEFDKVQKQIEDTRAVIDDLIPENIKQVASDTFEIFTETAQTVTIAGVIGVNPVTAIIVKEIMEANGADGALKQLDRLDNNLDTIIQGVQKGNIGTILDGLRETAHEAADVVTEINTANWKNFVQSTSYIDAVLGTNLHSQTDELETLGHQIDAIKEPVAKIAAVIAVSFIPGVGPIAAIALQAAFDELGKGESLFDKLQKGEIDDIGQLLEIAIDFVPGGTIATSLKAAAEAYEIYSTIMEQKEVLDALLVGDFEVIQATLEKEARDLALDIAAQYGAEFLSEHKDDILNMDIVDPDSINDVIELLEEGGQGVEELISKIELRSNQVQKLVSNPKDLIEELATEQLTHLATQEINIDNIASDELKILVQDFNKITNNIQIDVNNVKDQIKSANTTILASVTNDINSASTEFGLFKQKAQIILEPNILSVINDLDFSQPIDINTSKEASDILSKAIGELTDDQISAAQAISANQLTNAIDENSSLSDATAHAWLIKLQNDLSDIKTKVTNNIEIQMNEIAYPGSQATHSNNIPSDQYNGSDEDENLVFINKIYNVIKMSGGNDVVKGSRESDTIYGDEGWDKLYGNDGDDVLYGGEGQDLLNGGKGADQINGGNGIDTVDYSTSSEAISINLDAGMGFKGDAKGDILTSIEEIIGSNHSDDFVGKYESKNTIYGGAGNDKINGGSMRDLLSGESGNDHLIGGNGNDLLYGGLGNDILDGGYGSSDNLSGDDLYGGEGFDIADYTGSFGAVLIDLEENAGYWNAANLDTLNDIEGVRGSKYHDYLYGDQENNSLFGYDGHDYLYGRDGDDYLYGGDGDDSLSGGSGADYLNGGDGIDQAGYYTNHTGVTVNLATHMAYGGDATGDLLYNIEIVIGSAQYNDALYGDDNNNKLYGHGGHDWLEGGAGDDRMYGGDGHDRFVDINGTDEFDGGDGTDTVDFSKAEGQIVLNLADSYGTRGAANGDRFFSIENIIATNDALGDVIFGSSADNILTGLAGHDTLYGKDGNDILEGGTGDDVLSGGGGDDILIGDEGQDRLYGGGGDDYFEDINGTDEFDGGDGTDTVDFSKAEGQIVLNLADSYGTRGTANGDRFFSIENIIATNDALGDVIFGSSADNILTGLAGHDTLYGKDGNDILKGGTGDDMLSGGGGDDILIGNEGQDRLYGGGGDDYFEDINGTDEFDGGDGTDTVDFSKAQGQIVLNLADSYGTRGTANGDRFFSIENIIATNDALGDVIFGSSADNVLTGLAGHDTLYGKDGNDILKGGTGDDVLSGGGGDDYFEDINGTDEFDGGDGVDTVDFSKAREQVVLNLEDSYGTRGAANGDRFFDIEKVIGTYNEFGDVIFGSGADNILIGLGGHDTFYGMDGNDILEGGTGDDVLNGDNGNDHIYGGEGSDRLAGGSGWDIFDFSFLTDSNSFASDIISDFEQGLDIIDLSDISEISNLTNLNINHDTNSNITIVSANNADFTFTLNGIINLQDNDFTWT